MPTYRGMAAVKAKKLDQALVELHALDRAYRDQKIVFFRPLPGAPQYRQFFEDQCAVVRVVLGANRSSKTVTGVMESIAHSLGYRPWCSYNDPLRIVRLPGGDPIPVPNTGRILAQSYEQSIRQTIMEKFDEWAPKSMIRKIETNTRGIPVAIHWTNGSKVYLMSNDQDDMMFEGPAGHWFWVDEPCDRNKYIGLKRGLVDHNGHCWMTLTPLTQPWIYDDLVMKAGDTESQIKMYKFSIWDNCVERGGYLKRSAIEAFLADQREDELEARLHANFLHLAGRVYKTWIPAPPYWVPPFDIPLSWPRMMLCDPHSNKPIALMWAAISPSGRIFIYRATYTNTLVTVDDVADYIKQVEGWETWDSPGESAEQIAMRIIDWSAEEGERTSGVSIRAKFTDNKILMHKAKKVNAAFGYDAIHKALKLTREWDEPDIVVFNTCGPVRDNFMRFCHEDWANKRQADLKSPKETYRKKDDDFIDLIRYIYQSRMSYSSLRSEARRVAAEYEERSESQHNGRIFSRDGTRTGYMRLGR